jgi:hypothetical protein
MPFTIHFKYMTANMGQVKGRMKAMQRFIVHKEFQRTDHSRSDTVCVMNDVETM